MSDIAGSRIDFRAYADAAKLANETAAFITADLQRALAHKPRAKLVVPGGTTPAAMFDALSMAPLDWGRIGVTLSDERWVDVSDPASNQRQAQLRMLRGAASAADFVSWRGAGPDIATATAALNATLAPWAPFDVCVLGLGVDGHVASLIPGAEGLDAAMHDEGIVSAVHAPAAAGSVDRLTLTYSAIAASTRVVLLFTGETKRAVFDRALQGEGAAPIVKLLHEAQCPVQVCWAPE